MIASQNDSFVSVLIRPTSLVLKEHFFCILSVLTKLVSLISTKTKEYFFGRHLCIRSIEFLGTIRYMEFKFSVERFNF